jgi:hypothetical protein
MNDFGTLIIPKALMLETAWSLWLLLSSLDSAEDAVDPTLYSSRIDGCLDPFWRQS